jgi:para-aminobenzoate synthetase/4-amino-4-deoxychorismate lyase
VRLLLPGEGPPVLDARMLPPAPQVYRLGLARSPVDSLDPFLYHKTDHRDVYRRALAECPGCDDALLWNERGELTESCIASVVLELQGALFTPPLRSGLLPGIARSQLLAEGRVRERVLRPEDLPRCSRILLVNAVRGTWEAVLTRNPEAVQQPANGRS